MPKHHPVVDFKHWAGIFPIETFEKKEGLRRYSSAKPDDPTDLWKAHGTRITHDVRRCRMFVFPD